MNDLPVRKGISWDKVPIRVDVGIEVECPYKVHDIDVLRNDCEWATATEAEGKEK
jgi:hypothetical protein